MQRRRTLSPERRLTFREWREAIRMMRDKAPSGLEPLYEALQASA